MDFTFIAIGIAAVIIFYIAKLCLRADRKYRESQADAMIEEMKGPPTLVYMPKSHDAEIIKTIADSLRQESIVTIPRIPQNFTITTLSPCPACHHSNPQVANFCRRCGKSTKDYQAMDGTIEQRKSAFSAMYRAHQEFEKLSK